MMYKYIKILNFIMGAWWAAVYGVAQSRTRRKRLSGSRSSSPIFHPGRSQNTCLAKLMDGPGMALFAARVRHSSCLTALQVTLVRTFKAGSAQLGGGALGRLAPEREV